MLLRITNGPSSSYLPLVALLLLTRFALGLVLTLRFVFLGVDSRRLLGATPLLDFAHRCASIHAQHTAHITSSTFAVSHEIY